MQTPLITVGIPSYNHAKFLAKCLNSVVNQTYPNLEVIVVDNYSTDGTDDILSGFSDHRISVIKVNNGGSIAMSRNTILDKSRGEWIAFLDSDDWWKEDKLEKCAHNFRAGIDLIYHDLIVVDETTDRTQSMSIKSRKLEKPVFKDLIIKGNTIATSSVVVRKTILGKVNGMNESEEMFGIEDFNTWLKISQITDGFKLISQDLGFYRKHGKNMSSNSNFTQPIEAYKEFLPLLTKKEIQTMENNYFYMAARLNFLAKNNSIYKSNLFSVVRFGKLTNRIKSIYMLLVLGLRRWQK
jgi:glycosyltransferase involved in cell wall biosynthesis